MKISLNRNKRMSMKNEGKSGIYGKALIRAILRWVLFLHVCHRH